MVLELLVVVLVCHVFLATYCGRLFTQYTLRCHLRHGPGGDVTKLMTVSLQLYFHLYRLVCESLFHWFDRVGMSQ